MVRGFFVAIIAIAPVATAFEFSGTVLDEADQPIAGAAVWLAQDRRVLQTETGATGHFSFAKTNAGPTDVVARKDGYAIDGFSEFVAGLGSITLHLCKPDAVLLRIIDRDYKPVAGARIRNMFVADRFYVSIEHLAPMGFSDMRSGADGLLTIPDLPAGSHVRFLVSHYQHADTPVAYLPVGGKKQNIVLYSGLKLRGRVTTAAGHGVAGAEVSVFRLGTTGKHTYADTLTDPEGFYTARVRPGEYYVTVRHPDYASPEPRPIAMRQESDANVADLELLPPHTIEGTIVGPDGQPFEGVLVSYRVGNMLYLDTLTEHDGTFRILAPPGKGLIRIVPPEGFMAESLAEIPVQMGTESKVKLSNLRLKPLPEIAGIVRGNNGQPAPNILIASRDLLPPVWTITGADGRFRLRLSYMPEEAKATFRAEHALRFLRSDFAVNVQKPAPIDVELKSFKPDLEPRPPQPGGNDLSPMVDKAAPEIDCDAWFNSEALTLERRLGSVVVLTFWGGFDRRPENRDRIEELRVLHALLKDVPDVAIIGLHDSTTDPEEVRVYVEQYRIEFPVGCDARPFRTFERYLIRYIPQTVLIDKHGILRYYQVEGRLLELIKVLRRGGES